MRIAVTYEDGKVFQHFGHTETFKVYNVEDDKIESTEMLASNGSGHEALADVLKDNGVNVLICGGCGQGAQDALTASGIEVVSGAEGDTDEAVQAYLKGELVSAGVNCDHHGHDHEEGEGCGSNCGGGCSGCSGGCGSQMPLIEGPNAGKIVKVHYIGTFNDGTKFDSSYDRGEPIEFICGVGQMIPGFDMACASLEVGQVVDAKLTPDMAYGEHNPNAVFTFEQSMLPGSEDLEVGEDVVLTNSLGQPTQAKVTAKDETTITFDTNHPMVGKELNFRIEMIDIVS